MQGVIAITVSVLPFIWLFHAFELVSYAVSVPIFLFFLTALVIGIVYKARQNRVGPKVRAMRIAQTAKKAIQDNIHQLAVKQQSLIKTDDYGHQDASAVVREMDRFVACNIEQKLQVRLTPSERRKIFDIIRSQTKRFRHNNPSLFVEYAPSMDQAAYEAFCVGLLKLEGWKMRALPPEERGAGVDLVGERDGMVVAFQIRKSERPLGNRGVNAIQDGKEGVLATHAVIISNEQFVLSARQLASSLGVELWHHSDIGEGLCQGSGAGGGSTVPN